MKGPINREIRKVILDATNSDTIFFPNNNWVPIIYTNVHKCNFQGM